MKRFYRTQWFAWIAVPTMVVSPHALAASDAPHAAPTASKQLRVSDVELGAGASFVGQVVGPQGQPAVGAEVALNDGRHDILFRTDESGEFRATHLRSGVYRIRVGNQIQVCRVWQQGAAPPSANRGLLFVTNEQVVLGQQCGSPVGCGNAVDCGTCRPGLAHPLLFGGIVAAAIAIPVAIHNSDNDDPPAS